MEIPIPYGKQDITDEDIQAVIETLKSDFLTQGPRIAEFEEAFSKYAGSTFAVAISNGTAALHLCALSLDVKSGDKVITTPITFAASANCVRYCGGEVVFADIDPDTYLLDINKVRELLEASPMGTYKGIIPVDFAGRAVDLEAFRKLAMKYDLWIIEDACHAPGGYFTDSKGNQQFCGNGNFSDLAIFSFHPVKHIASGEGGMITTNNKELYEKLLKLRTHGITKKENEYKNSIEFAVGLPQNSSKDRRRLKLSEASEQAKTQIYPNWYMEMQDLGYNYRITDFQCALGNSQLKRADVGIKRRTEIAQTYYEAFQEIPEITDRNQEASKHFTVHNVPMTGCGHAYHLYVIEVEDRLGLYNYLRDHQIYAQIHYIPCHLMPYYRQFGWKAGDMPNAENYYKHCISLPMFPTLTDEQQGFVISKINGYYE